MVEMCRVELQSKNNLIKPSTCLVEVKLHSRDLLPKADARTKTNFRGLVCQTKSLVAINDPKCQPSDKPAKQGSTELTQL